MEPDLALNYDELGDVYSLMQEDSNAEKNYREALRRDPRLVNSYIGLAKIYQREKKYSAALSAIDAASKLDPSRTDIHYVRGQVLIHLGRKRARKNWRLPSASITKSAANAKNKWKPASFLRPNSYRTSNK